MLGLNCLRFFGRFYVPLFTLPSMVPLHVAGSVYRPRSGSAAPIQHQGRPSRRQRTHLRTPDSLMCHYHIPTNSTKIVNLLFFELGSFCHCHTVFTLLPNPKPSDILPPPLSPIAPLAVPNYVFGPCSFKRQHFFETIAKIEKKIGMFVQQMS